MMMYKTQMMNTIETRNINMLIIRTNYFKRTNANINRVHLNEQFIRFLPWIPQDRKSNENGNAGKSTDDASNLIKMKITSEQIISVVVQTKLITPRMMVPVFRSNTMQAFPTVGIVKPIVILYYIYLK